MGGFKIVSNKENNGYLLCDTCNGSYELQDGEKPEDFSFKCECGGNLRFFNKINDNSHPHDEIKTPKLTGKFVLVTILSVIIAGVLFPIGPIIAGFIIWWIFFHKKIRITQSDNQNKHPKSGILKGILYLALFLVVLIVYLSQSSALFKSAIWGMIIFGVVVVLFLLLRHFLNR